MLRTKSVYSPIHRKQDGLRILVTRFRGRGLATSRYDAWMANLGPSERLLRKFLASTDKTKGWRAFVKGYQEEQFAAAPLDRNNPTIKNHGQKFTLRLLKELARRQNVTLMCHCDEAQTMCHRHVLKRLIERA